MSEKTKQTGETRPTQWDWVEHSIWTDNMLAALEKGVKGGVWFSLIDKVYGPLYPLRRMAYGEGQQGQRRIGPPEHQGLRARSQR